MTGLRFVIRFLGLILWIPFSNCKQGSEQADRPLNLIPEEEFVSLLVDLSISESAANINIKQVSNLILDSVYAFNPLKERKIRKSQYDSTLAYYSEHIPEYKAVYESVLESISALQAQGAASKSMGKNK
ncbi:MAG: DUF4296 domain-containing protein [Bacteroidia bacterium]|nr:DUF4296 domain-containing protein [Bacteroidia bacterium]